MQDIMPIGVCSIMQDIMPIGVCSIMQESGQLETVELKCLFIVVYERGRQFYGNDGN